MFRLSSVSQREERSNVKSMSISFHPTFSYSGMFKSDNVALEFSARIAEIRWQCKMIADVVGNWLFDTIVLCHVLSRMLSKTLSQFDSVHKFDISFCSKHEKYFLP